MDRIILSEEYDHFKRIQAVDRLCERYSFIRRTVIGKSCSGKDIYALKIGNANSYSLIAAGVHGSERITSVVLLMYIEELCEALSRKGTISGLNAEKAFYGRGVIFVPCVNPDGCDISLLGEKACGEYSDRVYKQCAGDFSHWNANLRGVDINHNFDAGWENIHELEKKNGIYGPGPTRFGGTKPESEPETVALCDLCRKINIKSVLALHSQGEVIYWKYGKTTDKMRRMAEIMATTSGYALDTPINIASSGGFKDWFIEKFGRPGFTVEIGNGKNPLPARLADEIYHQIREMLTLFSVM